MHLRFIYLYTVGIFTLLIASASHADSITNDVEAVNITHIAVASNFTHTMKALIAQFEQQSPYKIKASYGSSGKIYAQIKHGAPFELFFSADQSKPMALYKEGLSHSEPFTYAFGALALWSNNNKFLSQHSLTKDSQSEYSRDKALTKQQMKVLLASANVNKLAFANPKLAPYGKAAMDVLLNLDLIKSTQKKWVNGENIAQTYQFVSSGNADLGFVALSQVIKQSPTASISNKQGQFKQEHFWKEQFWKVPANLYQPIRQDAILLIRGEHNKAALSFIQFLNSTEAQNLIQSYGYQFEEIQQSEKI